MTINIAVVTNEYVVLGCDSVASVTGMFLNPVQYAERDANGNYIQDQQGKYVARFEFEDLQEVVTDAWGGVTKMFCLCQANDNPIAAVTAGLAQLQNRTISSIAYDFLRTVAGQVPLTVKDIVEAFANHVAVLYDAHWAASGVPPAMRSDVEFLAGGFGAGDKFPSLYRINLLAQQENRVTALFGDGAEFKLGPTGVAWSGQADGVQRLLFGYDQPLKWRIQGQVRALVDGLHASMSEAALRILGDTLDALDQELPAQVDTELPPKPDIKLDWEQFELAINYASLPLQSAVELVSYLVNLQSGKSKFVRGVPTVGGRTHIGIVRKGGFEMLNEPQLTHRNTGYDRDL